MDSDFAADDLAREAAGDPPEPLGTTATAAGTVKYWKNEKGYGAIASEATRPWDIWCHFSAIDAPGFRALSPGDRVVVEYMRVNHGAFLYLANKVRRDSTGAG